MRWRKAALIGVGLLGGSLGLALKRRGLADSVHGFVRREASVRECEQLGVVDRAHLDLSAAVDGADLIVFCTPLAQMRELADQIKSRISGIVTDVGSVKASVVGELEPILPKFVGSHPIAGAEKTGPAAASAALFEQAICLITPTGNTDPEALDRIESLWRSVGAIPRRLSPQAHDELVSRSSHLPHVIAAELAKYVLDPSHAKEQALVCANGFRDTTRIASGSPEMWRDICVANRQHLLRALDDFANDLKGFRAALEKGDAAKVEEFFRTAKGRRDGWQGQKSSPSPE